MAGSAVSARNLRGAPSRRGLVRLFPLFLSGMLLTLAFGAPPVHASIAAGDCGAPVAPEDSAPKQINLVLDDSGSMFHEERGTKLLDRWSKAKYALEVFAALMNSRDTLVVYRLSDFVNAQASQRPVLQLSGKDSPEARVQEIRQMELNGRGTPFLAVENAFEDLLKSPDPDKWLVIVTDGEFDLERGNRLDEADLNKRLRGFVKEASDKGAPIRIAYLAIGEGIPRVTPDRALGIVSEDAPSADQLLLRMNALADRVYGRRDIQLERSAAWSPGEDSIELAQAIVFAQGDGVTIEPQMRVVSSAGQETSISGSVVDVTWSDNKPVERQGQLIQAQPDRSLQGQVAFFQGVPRGDVSLGIQNASPNVPVQVFYRPQVGLGYYLVDPRSGDPVNAIEPVEGEYKVEFYFSDSECNEVVSTLLGERAIDQVQISQGGSVIASGVKSGDIVDFPKGEVSFELAGTYLDGVTIANPTPLTRNFAQRALPGRIEAQTTTYLVSEMSEFPPLDRQIPLRYFIVEGNVERPPTAEEWASLDTSTFSFEHDSNLEFVLEKDATPGDLRLLTRAPDGDVFKADTGEIDVTVLGSYIPGQTEDLARADVKIDVEDDLSFWDRLAHWFGTTGWKILLGLILLAILLGYVFKRRFAKNVKRKPEITGTPRMIGMTPIRANGKFEVNRLRSFLPFLANTATLTYVPGGTAGFRKLKLKAGPGKSMIVTNWKDIASKDNVEINGTQLNEETRRPPRFGPSGTITAATPQMTYELTPNT